jgi:hypothetical protein
VLQGVRTAAANLSMQVWLAVMALKRAPDDWFTAAHHSSVYVLRLCCSVPILRILQNLQSKEAIPPVPQKASHFRIQNLFQKTSYSCFLIQLYLYVSPPRFLYTYFFISLILVHNY